MGVSIFRYLLGFTAGGVLLMTATPVLADQAMTVTATGTQLVRVLPSNRHSNASIRAAVQKAQRAGVGGALAAARVNALGYASAAGLTLGSVLSVSDASSASRLDGPFGPGGFFGPFGPGQYCGTQRQPVFKRVGSKHRRKLVGFKRVYSCFVPPFEATTLSVTYAAVVGGVEHRLPGWFVKNVADAAAFEHPRGGVTISFESREDRFPELGLNIRVLAPGQPAGQYHSESAQEDFLVLAGECLAIVEAQEQTLGAWDFLHCPTGTEHVLVGAGDGPCAILMVGARPEGKTLSYSVSELAGRYGASVAQKTTDPREAYADWGADFKPVLVDWPPRCGRALRARFQAVPC